MESDCRIVQTVRCPERLRLVAEGPESILIPCTLSAGHDSDHVFCKKTSIGDNYNLSEHVDVEVKWRRSIRPEQRTRHELAKVQMSWSYEGDSDANKKEEDE